MSPRSFEALSEAELEQMLALVSASDSVELKVTLAEGDHYSTLKRPGLDTLDSQIRQVFFFDTPELTLNNAGLVVRARRVQGKGDDSVLKLRPVVPGDLPDETRRSKSFNVEVDAGPDGFVCSGSLKATLGPGVVKESLEAGQPIKKLFTKEQRRFFREHSPPDVGWDDLVVLGPIFVLKLKFRPEELSWRAVAEMWLYPDFSRILELSTRCAPAEIHDVAVESRAYLTGRGVDLTAEQAAKTHTTPQFFSGRLTPGY